MRIQALCLSASALALTWCCVANAQTAPTPPTKSGTTVQEVVVTAERRSTSLQKTSIAATVMTGKDLIKQGVLTEDQLQFISPSVTVDNFGQGNDFDIRGIGKGEHNTQTGTGVVTYRDGVATFPGYFGEEPYFDVSELEVLRGPQGTFSGQNATGGAVIVNTANPVIGGGYDGYVLAHYGNYNDTGAQGAVNLPISDTLAARVAFNGDYRDTFYKISGLTGDPNTMWGSGRFSLLWTPTPSLKVLFKTDYDYLDNGGYFGDSLLLPNGQVNSQTSNLFKFGNNYETYATDQFSRTVLKIDYTNPDGIDFRSITGIQQGRTGWKGDIDGTASNLPGELNYMIAEGVDETLLSQEFNIISPSTGPLTWVLGTYYQHNEYNFPAGQFDIGVPHGPGGFDEDLYGTNITQTGAVFGQISYNLPAGFQIQVGARYSAWSTWNGTTYYVPQYEPYYNFPQNQYYAGNNLSGKVTLNWNLDAHNFLYAFVASGEKPGGLNTATYYATTTPGGGTVGAGYIPAPFEQETVTDYEVGWKSSMFDNHLHTQLGAYYNLFHNFQVIVPIPNDPVQDTEANDPNATKLYGVEASAQAAFGDFSATAGIGLEHSSLGTFYTEDNRVSSGGTCNPITGTPGNPACINLSGHPQTYAPNTTFNVSAQYNFRLGDGDVVTPSINYAYISQQWGTLFDNVSQGDYLAPRNILGSSVAYTHNGYVVTLYGYNLLDDHYVSAELPPIRIAGTPRQFGVSLMKTF